MRKIVLLLVLGMMLTISVPVSTAKDFLTDKEIEMIQDTHEIDKRTKIYLDAAAQRLKTAEDRIVGKEPEPGDPLEFFTPEDMLDSYYRIVKSIMMNLDEAVRKPGPNQQLVGKALKNLKSAMEKADEQLNILKKLAEEKKKEELWNLVNNALEITAGAHEGAEYGLAKEPPPEKKKSNK